MTLIKQKVIDMDSNIKEVAHLTVVQYPAKMPELSETEYLKHLQKSGIHLEQLRQAIQEIEAGQVVTMDLKFSSKRKTRRGKKIVNINA